MVALNFGLKRGQLAVDELSLVKVSYHNHLD